MLILKHLGLYTLGELRKSSNKNDISLNLSKKSFEKYFLKVYIRFLD